MRRQGNCAIIRAMLKSPSASQLLTMMDGLVRLPSMSSENLEFDVSNAAVIQRLAEWLEPLGFACEIIPNPGEPDKLNLIAVRGSGPGGLVLSGHADTVPYDEGHWRSDPFRLDERDGRLHGLGICDMKGFLAMAVAAAAEFQDQNFQQPLIIVATADEESGMDGIRALRNLGRPKARFAVIGEPTGMRPIRTHKGILMDAITVSGKAGHSSRPDLGANAIEGMHEAIARIMAFRQRLATNDAGGAFAINHPTLNLGCIHGGDSANRIPSRCQMQIDLRFPPGYQPQALREQLRAEFAAGLSTAGCSIEFETLFDGVPAFETPANSPLVAACERLTGHSAGAVDFATEGDFFSQMGMDTIILGPGGIEQAHQPDEYLALDRIAPMMDVLRGLIKQYCVQPAA